MAGDLVRWSAKSMLIDTLLNTWERVLYFDSDISIVGSWTFLVDELETSDVLLIPHWRCLAPHEGCRLYEANYWGGLFNAGFLGFSRNGREALQWWQDACRRYAGRQWPYWNDQRYLDVLPAEFERVRIIRHRGCNVATWNRHRNRRSRRDGHVWINDRWPVVFVHWSNFNPGVDPLLRGWYFEWLDEVTSERSR